MKKWKKFTNLLLSLVMCLSLTACGDTPEETISDTDMDIEEESNPVSDISGFTGCWKMENAPFYFVINDSYEWTAVNLYNVQIGPGYVTAEEDYITLCTEDGSTQIALWQTDEGNLKDKDNNLLLPTDYIMLLPTPEDELNQTTYFAGDFTNVSINYPIQMETFAQANTLGFDAVMKDGTDDLYSNILITFQPISGYDSYMEKGAGTAEPYMIKMLDQFMNNMYGDYLIKSLGSDFKDNGDYYSITGYMWIDGSIFTGSDLSQPVRGCMEVRYYGPTGYALIASTVAPESRIQNYFDICNNMLTTLSYTAGWSTAPKARPEQPKQSAYSSDSGDYGTPYYWYDDDGDIWYWNGYENVFMGFGSDSYIDSDTGEYMESNDAGWDYEDEYDDGWGDYIDDYDPWSDPGDGDDAWSDPGDTYDDYDSWSDPGDGDDAWSDPGDYYDDYDDGWGDYFE